MRLTNLIKKAKKALSHTLCKTIIVFIFPLIISMGFTIFNNIYHIHNYRSLITSNYSNELNVFLKNTEDKMNNIISCANLVANDTNVTNMLSVTQMPSLSESTSAILSLSYAKNFLDIIEDIAIYNKNGDFVVSSQGLYTTDTYFNTLYSYADYPLSYWQNYKGSTKNVKILPASAVINSNPSSTKTIIPVVFTSFKNLDENNIIIFNISTDTLFDSFNLHKLTPNTQLYMIDNKSNAVYSNIQTDTQPSLKHISAVKDSLRSNSDVVSINGNKYLSIQSTQRSNLWGYTYLVTVPYTDINNNISTIMLIVFISIFLLFIFMASFSMWGTKSLYSPWKNLVSNVNRFSQIDHDSKETSYNAEAYVLDYISTISDINKTLKDDLSISLPLSQEKYLIDILNNDNITPSDAEILKPLSFKYNYFISISINISINYAFFSECAEISGVDLLKEVYRVIYSTFSNSFITYKLPSTSNTLYLLLNLENDSFNTEIRSTIEQINDMFALDSENIDLVFGVGNIYEGFDGLKLTHKESNLNMIKILNSRKVQISNESTEYVFNSNSEVILTNYIMSGHHDKAKDFLNNIFDNIDNVSYSNKKQIYTDIIISLRKIMRQKNIGSNESSTNYLFDMLNNNTTFNEEKIRDSILELLDIINDSMKTYSSKVDIVNIINYINEHFTEDIFLDEFAQKYNTSSKYLSKRIKQYLNISFKDYLTQLRINKAKDLLENTNIKITDLYGQVGFQNRGAFTRAFKISTGLTPSEYKSHFNKNKKNY